MKKITTFITFCLALSFAMKAQAPQGFNYQAVARTSAGVAIISQPIGLEISIRQGSSGGAIVYTETHVATSNNIGLLNLVVGNGTAIFGTFNSINWANGPYFIEVSMDITGGTAYVVMGTQQLMSVPYALFAQNSPAGAIGATGATGTNGINGTPGATGATGTNGLNGNNGVAGATGATGNNGTNGTPGATGATGNNGTNGVAGTTGATGPTGIIGLTGVTGATGTNGVAGATGPTGSSGATLNSDYNFGGAGAGRTITANAGPVTINSSGTGAFGIALLAQQTGTGTSAIGASLSGTGNAINAVSSNAANTTSTIQATTNSSTANNSAVYGQSTGAARGVTGEIASTATADAGVFGNNLRTTGGMGVEGVGFNGVSGQSAYELGFGVFGSNSHTGGVSGDEAGVAGSGGF